MTRRGYLCVALAVALAPGRSRSADDLPRYVGRSVCLTCHGAKPATMATIKAATNGTANACAVQPIADHQRAYEALSDPKAKHIAALSGVGEPPTESRLCLTCHAAAADVGARWTLPSFALADGVQCESCHGAGGSHVERFQTPDDRTDEPTLIERGSRWECGVCHVERATHRMVLEEGYRVPDATARYKTPTNVLVSHDGATLFVVCENSNSLVVVDLGAGRVSGEIAVGRRPHDAALSPDGKTIYVSNRIGNTISVIDATARLVVGEIPGASEPHGLLTDRAGRALYVANTGDDSISVIDTATRGEVRRLAAGRGPWSMALAPKDGSLIVTNVRPFVPTFMAPAYSELTVIDVDSRVVARRPVVRDANMVQGVAALPSSSANGSEPIALCTLARTKNRVPLTRIAQGWTITNGLGVLSSDGRVDQLLLDEPGESFPDPNDVAVSPDGRIALVTSGGSDRVAVVDIPMLLTTITDHTPDERETVLPNHMGMSDRFVRRRIAVGANPRGVAFSPNGRFAYVTEALDDAVAVIDVAEMAVSDRIDLGGPAEVTELRRGERLFHSAGITYGRQFSCHSCHPDGHTNGLSFDIEADGVGLNPVDNRTLRGILDTAPFKWEGTNPSLSRQCGPRLAVFFTRLAPYSPDELQALVRYMCTIERPPNPHRAPDGLTPVQYRGRLVFRRTTDNGGRRIPPEKRCVTCHDGAYFTNRAKVRVFTTMWYDDPVGDEVDDLFDDDSFAALGIAYYYSADVRRALDVPHLNNIHDGAPYLHNGGAETLHELWARFNTFDWHGQTNDLTRRQLNDLIAYLEAL